MSTDFNNENIEIIAIKNIVSAKRTIRESLLSELKFHHFSNISLQQIFKRLKKLNREGHPTTSLKLLREDRTLSAEDKELISGPYVRLRKKTSADDLIRLLEEEHLRRDMYRFLNVGVAGLSKDTAPDEVLKILNENLTKVNQGSNRAYQSSSIGFNPRTGKFENTAKAIVGKIQKAVKSKKNFIKTGFTEFDNRSGGFSKQQLVVLASEISGGKSVLALQIGINAFLGYKNVCIYSLEMSSEDYWKRIMSNISKVEFGGIFRGEMGKKDRARIKRDFQLLAKHARKYRCTLDIRCPNYDISMSDIAAECQGNGVDMLIVDMITLLKRTEQSGNANEASVLSQMAREAKLAAKSLDCVVVVLAQLNDESKIKYSRGIIEHADFCWIWNRDEQSKTTNLLEIEQKKARNAEAFSFYLQERFDIMVVENPEDHQKERAIEYKKQQKDSEKKFSKRSRGSYTSGNMGLDDGFDL